MPETPKDIQEILDQATCGCQHQEKVKGRMQTCSCIQPVPNTGDKCRRCRNHQHTFETW